MKRSWLGWWVGAWVMAMGSGVQANPIVPANDGVGSVVNRLGNQFDITGGTRAGGNVFHSLLKFGLSEQQIANFLSQPSIRNILTRVTGGETSVINGLIRVSGGPSNLYLMNPAGIVFGAGARLDVPGSFHATTANAIKVGDGWFGMNTPPSELMRLTGEAGGFGFSQFNQSVNGELAGVIKNEGQLVAGAGQRVVLAGGVVVNTGVIATPHGQIVVTASPGGRYVEVTPAGSVLSFSLPVAVDEGVAVGNLRPLRWEDVGRLATGTLEVGGRLATASAVHNPHSRIELVGEQVRLNRVDLDNQGTDGLITVQVQPLVPVAGWVFLDRVPNYMDIANSLAVGNRLVLLNRSDSGVAKVNQALQGQTGVKELHLVGDGNAGQIWLGRDFITLDTVGNYAESLQRWGQVLEREGGIFLYACNLAQSVSGQALVEQIGALTGVRVGASTDITGHGQYGGNWTLEYGGNGNLPFVLSQIQDVDVKLMVFTVTNQADTALMGAPGELRSELDNANTTAGADIVRFNLGSAPATIALTLGELVVNDSTAGASTTFDNVGGTVTIDANGSSRVFNIAADNIVTFDGTQGGMVITGGDVFGNGGGILIDTNSNVTIQGNVTIQDNIADNGGGVFISTDSTLTMTGGAIRNNVAPGLAASGGGIANNGTLNLTNVTVANNGENPLIGSVNNGGGLANLTGSRATIANTTFSGNFANNGGAIDNQGTLIVTNSTIGNNEAALEGGGIRNLGGTATLNNVTMVGNQVTQSGQAGGGGLRNTGPVTIRNSMVAGNTDANGVATNEVSNAGTFANGVATNEVANAGTFTIPAPNLVGQNGNLGGFPVAASNIVVPGAVVGVQVAPLADNGGLTQTFALLSGSLAINASGAGATTSDQRGVAAEGIRDLGAFEFVVPVVPPPVPIPVVPPPVAIPVVPPPVAIPVVPPPVAIPVVPPPVVVETREVFTLPVELARFLTQEQEQLLFQPYLCRGETVLEGAPPPPLPDCVQADNVRPSVFFSDFLRN